MALGIVGCWEREQPGPGNSRVWGSSLGMGCDSLLQEDSGQWALLLTVHALGLPSGPCNGLPSLPVTLPVTGGSF